MHSTYRTPAIAIASGSPLLVDTDLIVVPAFEDDDPSSLAELDGATGGQLAGARARGELRARPFETVVATRTDRPVAAAVIGAGRREDCTSDRLRRIAAASGRLARQRRMTRLALVVPAIARIRPSDAVQAMAEGVTIANFEGASYKTAADAPVWLERVDLVAASAPELGEAVERGRVLGECTNLARSLANEPSNTLTPRVFADRALEIGRGAGLDVEVLDEHRIAELKMGLLLGVARGSQEPPRVVALRYEPAGLAGSPVLGLIGKGVTFDTGGISIKPADNMDRMKSDMSGGAAVLSAMVAIARLKAPIRCVAVIPLTENMPGGRAIKPGDILTSAEGKTVEVLNTDAEGRLILGDGLWYARRLGATHLVDVATLTGSIVVALGRTTSGLFGTPDAWAQQVRQASERAGDRCWPMPVFGDYMEQLKSEIADFTNTGGRNGGSITGALFIKEFAGGLPWVHLDIAGTAWAEEATPFQAKGATGVAVRTLAELALAGTTWSTL